jgi:hypothetical protein
MGTQGLPIKYPSNNRGLAGHILWAALSVVMVSALGGCSSSPSWSSSSSWGSPNQAAAVPVQPPPAQAAAAMPPAPDPNAKDPRLGAYPQQTLADNFRGSTSPSASANPSYGAYPAQSLFGSAQNVPHPPGTYTASAQPYTPPGGAPAGTAQAGTATAAASPPPPPEEQRPSAGYPSQSITDIFRQ